MGVHDLQKTNLAIWLAECNILYDSMVVLFITPTRDRGEKIINSDGWISDLFRVLIEEPFLRAGTHNTADKIIFS